MEIGNALSVSPSWRTNPDTAAGIVSCLLFNCLLTCKRMGIEPIGSLRMEVASSPYVAWDSVRYYFIPDE